MEPKNAPATVATKTEAPVAKTNFYPPGMEPADKVSEKSAPPTEPQVSAPTASTSRYPPGFAPPPETEKPKKMAVETKATPAPPAEKSEPAKAEKPVQSKVDHLLPPGAESIDALLPPGDTSAPTAKETGSVVPITPATIKAKAASLLPPGADEVEVATGEMQQVALPEKELEEAARPNLPLRADDGHVVKLHEPVKTVGKGVEERELHVLPPEEKRHRRFKWNLAFYVFAIAVLLAVFYVLTNWR
jgi:hypothetical protein